MEFDSPQFGFVNLRLAGHGSPVTARRFLRNRRLPQIDFSDFFNLFSADLKRRSLIPAKSVKVQIIAANDAGQAAPSTTAEIVVP
jgi:hypothetical protein